MEKMVCKENQFVRILVWNILGLVLAINVAFDESI